MKNNMRLILLSLLLPALLGVTGCAGGTKNKTDYYALSPLAQTQPQTRQMADFSGDTLALGPVTMPAYITSRAQIMAQDGPNQLVMLENARWAEPLDTNLMMVLTDNLTYLLNFGQVLQYPWRSSATFDYRVEITVFTFTSDRDKSYLRARYRITNVKTAQFAEADLDLAAPVQGFAAAEIVAAQNRLIDEASALLAEQIIKLSR